MSCMSKSTNETCNMQANELDENSFLLQSVQSICLKTITRTKEKARLRLGKLRLKDSEPSIMCYKFNFNVWNVLQDGKSSTISEFVLLFCFQRSKNYYFWY